MKPERLLRAILPDVLIVQTERRKKKSEKLVKKNYRKKPSGAARLSANDIMTQHKLKAYQDGMHWLWQNTD